MLFGLSAEFKHFMGNFVDKNRPDWVECSAKYFAAKTRNDSYFFLAKYFASIRCKIKTNQCVHVQLGGLHRISSPDFENA